MFKKLFKKNNEIDFLMPISGEILSLDSAPDPVFSGKMMGDGFCIKPASGKVYSPVSGKIASVFPTKHCVGIVSDEGHEWLIHFGMDTVKLNGEGFNLLIEQDQSIKAGDLLFEVDLEGIAPKIPSTITPVILTNLGDKSISFSFTGNVMNNDKYTIEIK